MSRHRKKRGFRVFSLILLVLLVCVALGLAYFRPRPDAGAALRDALGQLPMPEAPSLSGLDSEVAAAAARCFSLRADGPVTQSYTRADGTVTITALDEARLTEGLAEEMQAMLTEKAASAKRRTELYADGDSLLPELGMSFYTAVMEKRLAHAEDYCRQETLPVTLLWTRGSWVLQDTEALSSRLNIGFPSLPGYEQAAAALEPVEPHYALPLSGPGPVPDMSCYGMTTNPQDIVDLLSSSTAQRLIGGQKLDFDPNRDMLGRAIYYYLDETILAIVWQQDEHGAIGTFAEVFIADASQLRRKLADDSFGSYQLYYASEMAAEANGVVTGSGDYYMNGRGDFGLVVYEGQLLRAGLHTGQSCLFDRSGDMLFVYEDAFSSTEEAQRFIDENGVSFSFSWGPVLIDHGEDVTPYDYPIGEVRDTYARCAIGQLGTRHYLLMTINCEQPDHYYLVTLRQAADSMIAHGCYNAYTLDGGQTASILIGGQLINPVQFGYERLVSDIFYFATALQPE